ncbi:hypothetical protein M5F03_09460 [Acinetobacter sp. ANC 5579]|uniref:toxin VasX n=1 Tax=Acinetobacter amyesii TaxID=2942470 RepID=UPI0020BF5243|nr:toxin VasX [Acinetobacter amyesii]MCL6235386.1 hypothetical protein [Acinetobacter amyesii]
MAINDLNCNFCKRDEGLRVFLTRPLLIKGKSDISSFGSNEDDPAYIKIEKYYHNIVERYSGGSVLENLKNDVQRDTETSSLEGLEETERDYNNFRNFEYDKYSISENFCFTQTLLRTGFIYVYYPKNKMLEEYYISKNGFIKKINKNESLSATEEPCTQWHHRLNALTITILKPQDHPIVYLTFSDVRWTNDIKERKVHNSNFYEKLQSFSPQKWVTGEDMQKLLPISADTINVIEDALLENISREDKKSFSIRPSILGTAKIPSNKPKNLIPKYLADSLTFKDNLNSVNNGFIQALDRLGTVTLTTSNDSYVNLEDPRVFHKLNEDERNFLLENPSDLRAYNGLIFCLDDPIGNAMDAGKYVTDFYAEAVESSEFFSDIERTAIQVNNLRKQIQHINLIEEQYKRQADLDNSKAWGIFGRGVAGATNPQALEYYDNEMENISPEKLKELNKKAFKKFDDCIDHHLLDSALLSAQTKDILIYTSAKEFEQNYINILTSDIFKKVFKNFFDESDLESNIDYVNIVSLVVNGISVSSNLVNFVEENYLNKEISDENFILNGLVANNNEIKKIISNPVGFATLYLPALTDSINKFIGELNTPRLNILYDSLGQSFVSLQAAITKIKPGNSIAVDKYRREIILLNSWGTKLGDGGKKIYTYRGSAENLQRGIAHLVHEMALQSGNKRAIENIEQALNNNASGISKKISEFSDLKGTISVDFVLNSNSNIPFNITTNKDLSRALVEQFEVALNNDALNFSQNHFQAFLGITSGIFQTLFIKSSYEGFIKDPKSAEYISKFFGGVASIGYAVTDGVYKISSTLASANALRTGSAYTQNEVMKRLFSAKGNKYAVLITTYMTTGVDAFKGIKSIIVDRERNLDTFTSTGGNALMLVATHIMFRGTNQMKALAIVMFSIGLGVLYWNAKIKESSLQQWLRLSFVGNREGLKGVPYTSYAQQQKDFSKVFS